MRRSKIHLRSSGSSLASPPARDSERPCDLWTATWTVSCNVEKPCGRISRPADLDALLVSSRDQRLLSDGFHRGFLGSARRAAERPHPLRRPLHDAAAAGMPGPGGRIRPAGQSMSQAIVQAVGTHGHRAAGLRVERPERGRVRDDPAGRARGEPGRRRRNGSRPSDRSRTARRSRRSGRRSPLPSRRSGCSCPSPSGG